MSRYIEINSSYRDRNSWPLPAQFEIPISQSGRKSKDDALDPVCLSTTQKQWSSNNLDTSSSQTISGNIDNSQPVSNTSDGSTFIINTSRTFQQEEDYYIGLIIRNTTTSTERRISAFEYLYNKSGKDYAQITVLVQFSDAAFHLGDSYTIKDPTDFSDPSNPLIFVPAGEIQQNAYANCILYNETLKQYRKTVDFDGTTHILKIDATIPVVGWSATDNFSIRIQPPSFSTTVGASPTTSQIVITNGLPEDNVYKNQHVRILPSPSGVYNYPLISPINETSRIISYDGTTKIATIYPPFGTAPSTGQDVEILDFSYDNLNPFAYTGNIVSQQEMVCYEIELLNIILPNQTLNSGKGGRLAFYPHIYVELSNVSASGAGLKNVIYSNNPNAVKTTFRVPISDMSNPLISQFTKNDASGMVQTIKFKPNDTLFFSVRLPDGEIFNTILDEHYSPYPPNYHAQISAAFRINRI